MADILRQGTNFGITMSPVANYTVMNEPTNAQMQNDTIFYYGFMAWDGGWYIQQRDTTLGTNLYYFGSGAYNYTNRLNYNYVAFDQAVRRL